MKRSVIKLFAPIGILGLAFGHAYANELPLPQYSENRSIFSDEDENGYIRIISPECGMVIGENGVGKKYIMQDDLSCTREELRIKNTNAALTIAGEGTVLDLNGHTIMYLDRQQPNKSSQTTNEIHTIGIHMRGTKGCLIGINPTGEPDECNNTAEVMEHQEQGYATIWNFNVGVEIGTANYPILSTSKEGYPHENLGGNTIKAIQVITCNAGFRLLNDKNYITQSKALCGKAPVATHHQESGKFTVKESRDGFVLGIKALTTKRHVSSNACTEGNEILPSVYGNTVINNIAQGNINGFVGGNELRIPRYQHGINLITNVFKNNYASENSGDGFLISGTGHRLIKNTTKYNGANGVNVSRNHPDCGPQFGIVNVVRGTLAEGNAANGIAAILAGTNERNPGGLFIKNLSSDNKEYDLYDNTQGSDDNFDCSNGRSESDILNRWLYNPASVHKAMPVCTIGF